MKRRMLAGKHYAQVFWTVIQRVFVDMMDNLSSGKLTSYHAFCHHAVLVRPSLSVVHFDDTVRGRVGAVQSCCANGMRHANSVDSSPSLGLQLRTGCSRLAEFAPLGVVKRLAILSQDPIYGIAACVARLRGELFSHAATYANYNRSASCL